MRFYGLKNLEQQKERLLQVLELLKPKSKIQFAILTKVRARDIFSATKIGNEELNKILSYLQFEYGYLRGDIAKKNIILYVSPVGDLKVNTVNIEDADPQKGMVKKSFVQPRRFADKLNLIRNYSNRNFFENILTWYGYSMQKNNETSRFLALWIALESLLAKDIGESEGPFIADVGSKILSLYLVRKIIRNLWADLCRLSLQNHIAKDFSISLTDEGVDESDLLYVIMMQGHELEEILRKKYHSELLSYRIYSYRQIFSSLSRTKNTINEYAKHVKCNFLRHYNLRNRIVHTGYHSNNITFYHFQLDYYFRIIFENIIHFCIIHPDDSISRNIQRIKSEQELYLRSIDIGVLDWGKKDIRERIEKDKFKDSLRRGIIDSVGSK